MIAYLITNLINGKSYVGISRKPLRKRWLDHMGFARSGGGSRPLGVLHKAIRKHGASNFSIEHVASARSWDALCDIERILIGQHNTHFQRGHGYNMTDGGAGASGRVYVCSPSTSAKLSLSLKGGKRSPAGCANISAGKKGRKFTEKAAAAINASRQTSEYRERARQIALVRFNTVEFKAMMQRTAKERRDHRMKTSRQLALTLCMTILLGAVSIQRPASAQSLHPIDWYVAHAAERHATQQFCRNNLAYQHDADCNNAEMAENRTWSRRTASAFDRLNATLNSPRYWAENRSTRGGALVECSGGAAVNTLTPSQCAAARAGEAMDGSVYTRAGRNGR